MELSQEQKLYAEIVQKAWEDAEFKKELISNPVAVIEALTGSKFDLPEGKTLVVKDQTDESTIYINIPAKVEVDVELSENELETVSGGVVATGIIDGGCFPTFPPKTPFPFPDDVLF